MATSLFVDTATSGILDTALYADRPDSSIHVLDIPPRTSLNFDPRKVCVLVHGFTQTGHSWEPLVQGSGGLCDQGYRSLCIDLRGHGLSGWVRSGDYSRSSMVADILAVVDALALDCFFLFGLSLGGALVTKFAADHPARVRSLVIVDWAPWPGGKPTPGVVRISSLFNLHWDSFEEAVDMMHRANPRRSRENVAMRMRQQLRQASDGWRWGTDPAIAKDAALRAQESPDVMWRSVDAVPCETLLLRGEESDVLPQSQAEVMARRLHRGSLAVIPGAGHSVIGDNPAQSMSVIMPFLALGIGAGSSRL